MKTQSDRVGMSKAKPKAIDSRVICRVCGGVHGQRFGANGFDWFSCSECRTTQKILTEQEYQRLNPSYDPGVYFDSMDRKAIEQILDVDAAVQTLASVVNKHLNRATDGSKPSFLDIGCGMGVYLIAAQRLGFDVLGFEPSSNHARVATQLLNLPVVTDFFSPRAVQGKKFDLVVLSHVIEHIYDPKQFLHQIIEVMNPGGALVVVTPNNESLLASFLGKHWPMLKPIDHVSLIGAKAYDFFQLSSVATVHHSSSEFPFEFAASALSVFKSRISRSRDKSTNSKGDTISAPAPLKGAGLKAKVLRYGLATVSLPLHVAAIATQRQACLTTIIALKE